MKLTSGCWLGHLPSGGAYRCPSLLSLGCAAGLSAPFFVLGAITCGIGIGSMQLPVSAVMVVLRGCADLGRRALAGGCGSAVPISVPRYPASRSYNDPKAVAATPPASVGNATLRTTDPRATERPPRSFRIVCCRDSATLRTESIVVCGNRYPPRITGHRRLRSGSDRRHRRCVRRESHAAATFVGQACGSRNRGPGAPPGSRFLHRLRCRCRLSA